MVAEGLQHLGGRVAEQVDVAEDGGRATRDARRRPAATQHDGTKQQFAGPGRSPVRPVRPVRLGRVGGHFEVAPAGGVDPGGVGQWPGGADPRQVLGRRPFIRPEAEGARAAGQGDPDSG